MNASQYAKRYPFARRTTLEALERRDAKTRQLRAEIEARTRPKSSIAKVFYDLAAYMTEQLRRQ